jgi:hypothetical protein
MTNTVGCLEQLLNMVVCLIWLQQKAMVIKENLVTWVMGHTGHGSLVTQVKGHTGSS